jgi:hypothetical protein
MNSPSTKLKLANPVDREFGVPDRLREDRTDIVIIDLDRIALDHRPALVGNLILSTPLWCFSDVTGVDNLMPRAAHEEVTICLLQLIPWEAIGKPISLGPAIDPHDHGVWVESLALRKEKGNAFEKHQALVMPGKFFEETQVNGGDANEKWRTRDHMDISPRQFWFPEFCFPLFLVDGIVAPALLLLEPAEQRLVSGLPLRARAIVG